MVDIDVELEGMANTKAELEEIEANWADEEDVVYVVGPSAEYAIFVEFGTDPHLITPDDAEALKFEGKILPGVPETETIFATRVLHPGTDAQPFMRPALRYIERNAARFATDADSLEQLIGKLAFKLERRAKREAPVDDGNLRASIAAVKVS